MEECYICFSKFQNENFEMLPCSHKVCNTCYLRLDKPKCPLCRKEFIYSKKDINKRKEIGIENKYNSPSVQQNYIDRTRINDFSQLNIRRRNNEDVALTDYNNIGIMGRQRFRKRRKNLSDEEIQEKRKIIREKCRKKWMIKENRLNKVNWYDIQI